MRNFLLVLLIPLFLIACGSDSQVDEQEDVIVSLLSELKGVEEEPILTARKGLEYGSSVYINSIVEGNVSQSGEIKYYFEPYNSELVIFMIDGPVEEVSLEVEEIEGGGGESFRGFYSSSIEIVSVSAGERYLITVFNEASLGKTKIKIVQANRESLSLLKNEFVFKESIIDHQKCNDEMKVFERDIYTWYRFGAAYSVEAPIGNSGAWAHYATDSFDARNQSDKIYNLTTNSACDLFSDQGVLECIGDYLIYINNLDANDNQVSLETCEGYFEVFGEVIL